VRVNPLFVASATRYVWVFRWPSFVAVKSGTKINSVLDFPTSMHRIDSVVGA
jgi:peptide methionine sulfoxide reductase MsrB